MTNRFTVIDTQTGKAPDLECIPYQELWCKGLSSSVEVEGFAVCENGRLVLMDECGNYVECPAGRFELRWEGVD